MEYKDTIFLPKTSFEMRANLPMKEPKILEEWDNQKIYIQLNTRKELLNQRKEKGVLKEKKNNLIKPCSNFLDYFCRHISPHL